MSTFGATLRETRMQWGLSLREVRTRSAALAEQWGNPSYEISGSWLARLEGGRHEMTVPKLISLATIYSEPPEELLRRCHPGQPQLQLGQVTSPNTTILLKHGSSLDQQARDLLPNQLNADTIPEETTLLPMGNEALSSQYRQVIVGQRDRTLDPMIRPGSILKIDTQKRTIAHRREWTNEFDRPIYLFLTHTGYVCGWCELDKDKTWLTLVTHSLSTGSCKRWRYRNEVEVVGRAVAVVMRLMPLGS